MKLFMITILSLWFSLECFALQSGWIVKDTTVQKTEEGKTIALFDIILSATTPEELNVSFATVDGSAKEGKDYKKTNGTFTLHPGQSTGKIAVEIINSKTQAKGDKEFYLQLSSNRIPLFRPKAKCTILSYVATTPLKSETSPSGKGAHNVSK